MLVGSGTAATTTTTTSARPEFSDSTSTLFAAGLLSTCRMTTRFSNHGSFQCWNCSSEATLPDQSLNMTFKITTVELICARQDPKSKNRTINSPLMPPIMIPLIICFATEHSDTRETPFSSFHSFKRRLNRAACSLGKTSHPGGLKEKRKKILGICVNALFCWRKKKSRSVYGAGLHFSSLPAVKTMDVLLSLQQRL